MAWNETCVMDLKVSLVSDWLSGCYTKTMLANKYGISRPTVNKWLGRYDEDSAEGLYDQSRRPHSCPHQTPDEVIEELIKLKQGFPYWGPKKINDLLKLQKPWLKCPADSTTGQILKKAGLVKAKKRSRKISVYPSKLTKSERSCEVWNIDFKGQAKLGNGHWCYPLTITDDFSRFLLCLEAQKSTKAKPVKENLERLFTDYGLPNVIKSDNGTPFASRAVGGLSNLSIWLIKLGITPERIEKGKPTQNGRHERMHRTLKMEAMKPMKYSFLAQQQAFNRFKEEYNCLRSHEGLDRKRPVESFKKSNREYKPKQLEVNYDLDMEIRSVRCNGEIKWKGNLLYCGEILAKEKVGLKEVHDGVYEIYFSFMHIGYLNERYMQINRIK